MKNRQRVGEGVPAAAVVYEARISTALFGEELETCENDMRLWGDGDADGMAL